MMGKYKLVTIGCSAGGVEALRKILPFLPANYPLPIVVIQHRGPDSPQILTSFFSEICALKVIEPDDKEPLERGAIYIAPANYHLMMDEKFCFNLSVDEAVQFSRPSIDVFFETAAEVFGQELIGIILSGANADGTKGLLEIKRRGGLTLAQDPASTEFSTMPQAAVAAGAVDHVVSLERILKLLTELGDFDGKSQSTSC